MLASRTQVVLNQAIKLYFVANFCSDSSIKTFETEFKRGGIDYRQSWRQKDVAVYEYGSAPRYELVILRVREEHLLPNGKPHPRGETYPATSQWGQYGWTLGPRDREVAIHIAETIVDLTPDKRILRIHAVMDCWIATRASLQSVNPTSYSPPAR